MKSYSLKTFANRFSFIDNKDMGILRLDAPLRDESNKPYFIKIQSLVAEIMRSNFCPKIPILNNFINFDMHKYHDVSTTSDWILMFYGSLDSSFQGALPPIFSYRYY